jgi:arsenate reductase
MMMYGIKNCDTIKKARKWLDANAIAYEFHDLRVDGLTQDMIESWLESVSWEKLLNKRATTWRQLDDPRKDDLNQAVAIELMLANPTLIKRPVVFVDNSTCIVGFKEADYLTHFGK